MATPLPWKNKQPYGSRWTHKLVRRGQVRVPIQHEQERSLNRPERRQRVSDQLLFRHGPQKDALTKQTAQHRRANPLVQDAVAKEEYKIGFKAAVHSECIYPLISFVPKTASFTRFRPMKFPWVHKEITRSRFRDE